MNRIDCKALEMQVTLTLGPLLSCLTTPQSSITQVLEEPVQGQQEANLESGIP